jgi:predicted unusual protein kinase regulating ubiquinone biosynthesis (AarF/ABC1/UbiB family)
VPKDADIPTGRLRRTARLGAVVGGTAARSAAAAVRRGEPDEADRERRRVEAAERLVDALGELRGAAMKLGQILSFVDTDLVPAEHRSALQERLARLRTQAPALPWPRVREVLRDEWDADPDELLASIEPQAAAAASIGQVHRAVLRDGRHVAVKVQYPGIAEAVRADLRNVGLLALLARAIAPGIDAKALAAELRERVLEELDYELEADAQRTFARAYRGHPFVRVPEVVTPLCRRRVLVSEWVDGAAFDAVRSLPRAERDRYGEIVFRFAFGSVYHLGRFNADTHPGNYLLQEDGRVAFLDFGMTKRLDRRQIALEVACIEAVLEDDPERLRDRLGELGFVPDPDSVDARALMRHVQAVGGWYMDDRPITLGPERVVEALAASTDPRSEHAELLRRESLPPDELLGRRMETGVLAVLAQLGATRNWTRIGREWWFGDPPSTQLGEAEWAFFGRRPQGVALQRPRVSPC